MDESGKTFHVADPPDGGMAEKIAFGPHGLTCDPAEIAAISAAPSPEWTVTVTPPRKRWWLRWLPRL